MTLAAIIALVAWCFFWIIRDDIRTRRETAFDAHADDAIRTSEPPTPLVSAGPLFLDEWSDTPVHDAIALERLRAGLEGWGK